MSLQTKLRIHHMIAVMYKDEHENVISIIVRYIFVNTYTYLFIYIFFSEN